MTAHEARIEAAHVWLMAAESAGLAVTMVGGQVYCGARVPDQKVRTLLGSRRDHKPARCLPDQKSWRANDEHTALTTPQPFPAP